MSKGLMSPFKALSKLTYRANMDTDTTVEQCLEWYEIVAIALKVLELIKKKGVDINALRVCKHCKTPKRYNTQTSYFYHEELTQEEYDLLKEVLL